jgi:hypothetical protein
LEKSRLSIRLLSPANEERKAQLRAQLEAQSWNPNLPFFVEILPCSRDIFQAMMNASKDIQEVAIKKQRWL